MLKTVPILNNKGGVGKTTTAVNVAAGLAHRDYKVLLIDLDSQGSASLSLGLSRENLSPSSAEVLYGDTPVDEAIRPTNLPGLDLITGSLDLANADLRLKQLEDGKRRLRHVLEQVAPSYDKIIVDCAPSTSTLTVNALIAADAFVIPVTPSYLALEGVVSLGQVIRRVRRGMGEAAPVLGILLTVVDRSDEQVPSVIDQIRHHYGGKVFDTEIREDTAVDEAPSNNQDIFSYAPESRGAHDYGQLLDEMEERFQRYGSVYNRINQKNRREQASS
jgi:chromosome partitioning protein